MFSDVGVSNRVKGQLMDLRIYKCSDKKYINNSDKIKQQKKLFNCQNNSCS